MLEIDDELYTRLRPAMLRTLADLARLGFVTPLNDGLDLVHDFFLEQWPSVVRTHDPARGALRTYAVAAFRFYARAQIARRWQARERSLDARDLAGRVAARPADAPPRVDADDVQRVLAALPAEQRDLLDGYFGHPPLSERALAARRGVSRHECHTQLLEAIARVAVGLGERGRIDPADWPVARELWGDGRTTREVAGRLGLSMHEVARVRNRMLDRLADGIGRRSRRGADGAHDDREATPMIQPERGGRDEMTPRLAIDQLLSCRGDAWPPDLLAAVRAHAAPIFDHLEADPELADRLGQRLDAMSPDAVAALYEALAGDEPEMTEEDNDLAPVLAQAQHQSDKWIGEAFAVMASGLPAMLHEIERFFHDVPPVAAPLAQRLREAPSSRAAAIAPTLLTALVERGLTPVTIFQATEAVPALLRQFHRRGQLDANATDLVLHDDGHLRGPISWDAPMLFERVVHAADCTVPVARALIRWLVAVAQARPLLFGGLSAIPSGKDSVALTMLDGAKALPIDRRLMTRWTTPFEVKELNPDWFLGRYGSWVATNVRPARQENPFLYGKKDEIC